MTTQTDSANVGLAARLKTLSGRYVKNRGIYAGPYGLGHALSQQYGWCIMPDCGWYDPETKKGGPLYKKQINGCALVLGLGISFDSPFVLNMDSLPPEATETIGRELEIIEDVMDSIDEDYLGR